MVEGNGGGTRGVGGEGGFAGETVAEEGGHGVRLVHGGQAEYAFDGVEHGGLVVEVGDGFSAFGVGADDEAQGAVSVDVVEAVLGVVFDDEDRGFGPEGTLADAFDDAAECKVVVSNFGAVQPSI